MATVQTAIDLARNVYLNDAGAAIYTNTRMLEWMKLAYMDLKNALQIVNDQVFREITAVAYTANSATLTVSGLDKPVYLEERPSTSTSATDYRRIDERMWELGEEASENLRYWSWREGTINVLPATTDRTVRAYYDKTITDFSAVGDTIPSDRWVPYLAAKASEYAAMALGNPTRSNFCAAKAEMALDDIERLSVKKLQSLPVKRRPYRGRRPFVINT